ncbi:hypothetical protein JCM33374_g6536 [Metschnikowia sp. JCM 33374]|nr:hypothetical protein JCM33374_g6536 [Metschnikowia sp. JCM 33374]
MSFSPDIFRKKLDALQETQDSIVSISQWVLFHHRHAAHLCELWAEYTLTSDQAKSSKKKLSLLYLCNDVVQQARAKRKPEFSAGFATKLPTVIHSIYGSVDAPIKPKIERLISVWSQRNVFTKPQIDAMNRAVRSSKDGTEFDAEADAAEASQNMAHKASSGPQIATDLVHLNNIYTHMTTLLDTSSANLAQVGQQSKTYLPEDHSTSDNLPSPKVYVSKLNVLEKLCFLTMQNLNEAKKTRQDILNVLGQLTNLVSGGADADDAKIDLLSKKLNQISTTRGELLEMIDEPESPQDSEINSIQQQPKQQEDADEEPSPVFDTMNSEINPEANESLVPTYEDSSDDSDTDSLPKEEPKTQSGDSHIPPPPSLNRKRKISESSTTSGSSKKSVAFSEQIEVKEFERDEHSNYIDILGDNGHSNGHGYDDDEEDGTGENITEVHNFELNHKDALELMHEHQSAPEPQPFDDHSQVENLDKDSLLSLLSKLN